MSKLVTIDHSQASAEQRAGRAGRLGPGVASGCGRRWSTPPDRNTISPRYSDRSSPRSSRVAGMGCAGTDRSFDFSINPRTQPSRRRFEVLEMLGAVDATIGSHQPGLRCSRCRCTPVWQRWFPRLVTARLDGRRAVLAALLTERDVIGGRPSERPVDLWPRVQLVVDEQFRMPECRSGAVRSARRQARDIARRIAASRPWCPGRSRALPGARLSGSDRAETRRSGRSFPSAQRDGSRGRQGRSARALRHDRRCRIVGRQTIDSNQTRDRYRHDRCRVGLRFGGHRADVLRLGRVADDLVVRSRAPPRRSRFRDAGAKARALRTDDELRSIDRLSRPGSRSSRGRTPLATGKRGSSLLPTSTCARRASDRRCDTDLGSDRRSSGRIC